MVSAADVDRKVTKLQEEVAKLKQIPANEEFEKLEEVYKSKLLDLETKYERKLESVELRFNTILETQSKTTLEAMATIIKNLDTKVDSLKIKLHDIEKLPLTNQPTPASDDSMARITELERKYRELDKTVDDIFERVEAEGDNINDTPNKKTISLASLEARVDKLEDYSRRDNLLFFGFNEQKDENCFEKVKKFICDVLLNGDDDAENIEFIRAHRLGQFNNRYKRPIIVKFKQYKDKMSVLKSTKVLQEYNETNESFYTVSEDFSENTTTIRKSLQKCVKPVKAKLGEKAKAVFVRYKSLVVLDANSKYNTYPAYVVKTLQGEFGDDWIENLNVMPPQGRGQGGRFG